MDPVKLSRKRLVLSLAGAAALVAVVSIGLAWPRLLAEYHCRRIQWAASYEEAVPWLELLAQDARGTGVGEAIAWKLGTGRQDLTFRFFRYLFDEQLRDPPEFQAFFPSHLGRFLPVIRAFCARAKRDPEILALCVHYGRWKGELDEEIRRLGPKHFTFGYLLGGLIAPLLGPNAFLAEEEDFARKHPETLEAGLHLLGLRGQSLAWFLGMPSLSEVPDFSAHSWPQNLDKARQWEAEAEWRMLAWVREHGRQLKFDPSLGHFVLTEEETGSEFTLPSKPTLPFPVWRGPPPQ